ncbi:glycosyltransferase [Candidatus Omnitrophota bacterium]
MNANQKTKKPAVTIIVVNHNGKKYLKRCFDSLLRLNFPKNKLEIIMVDNLSRDGSVAFIKKHYPRTVVIENEINNYCRANNLGIQRAKGEFVALLNNDTRVSVDWLAQLVKTIKKDKDIAAVGSKVLLKNGVINSTGHVELPNYYWADRGFQETDQGQYDQTHEVQSISGVACLFRRKYLQQAGLFDEDFQMFLEDVDISIRLKKQGGRIVYCSQSIVYHTFHGTATDDLVSFYIERNRLLLLAKHYPEQLGRAFLSNGYFTLKTSVNGHQDIYEILPMILTKFLSHHQSETINKLLPALFANLKKNLNLEKHNLIQTLGHERDALQLHAQDISHKTILLQEKDTRLAQLNQHLEQHLHQLELKAHAIQQKDILLQEKDTDLNRLNQQLQQQLEQLELKAQTIQQKDSLLQEKDTRLAQLNQQLQQKLTEFNLKVQDITHKDSLLQQKDNDLAQLNQKLQQKLTGLSLKTQEITHKDSLLQGKDAELNRLNQQLQLQLDQLELRAQSVASKDSLLQEKDNDLARLNQELQQQLTELNLKIQDIAHKDSLLQLRLQQLEQNNAQLAQKNNLLAEKERLLSSLQAEFEKTVQALNVKSNEADNFQGQLSDFYSTETFRYIIRPLWKSFDFLKSISKIRRRRLAAPKKTITQQRTLLIKPQKVSVEDTESIIKDFKAKHPEAHLSLMANLLQADYERLSQNNLIDEKLLFCSYSREFSTWEQVKLILNLRKPRFDTAIVLTGQFAYPGYRRARILALLSGAKEIRQQSVQRGHKKEGLSKDKVTKKITAIKEVAKQLLSLPGQMIFLAATILVFLVFVVGGIKIKKIIHKFKKRLGIKR